MISNCNKLTIDKVIPVEENKRKFIINNKNSLKINKVKVDGCYKTEGKKCDYLFEVIIEDTIAKVFYVELKGCRLNDALEQLLETINYCLSIHKQISRTAVAVVSRTPKITTAIQIFKKKFKSIDIELITKNSEYSVFI